MSCVITDMCLFIMLLEGEHDYATLDIKQGWFNSCIIKIYIIKYYSGSA